MESDLANLIDSRKYRLGIIRLGYVGLPLIDAFISAGFHCVGFDIDNEKVKLLNSGKSYIKHVDSKKIQSWIDKQRFEATSEMDRLGEPDALLICVPTPLDKHRKTKSSHPE